MKILKALLYALLGFIFIFLVANVFFPSTFSVEKNITISSSPSFVFHQVNSFKNWENWNPWLDDDPDMTFEYNTTEYGVGAIKNWKSEKSSNGKMEIYESSFVNYIKFKISIEGWNSFDGTFNFQPLENGVLVSWKDQGELPFLMKVMGPLLSKMIGQDLEKGLNNLKRYCESLPAQSGEINMNEFSSKVELFTSDSCTYKDLTSTLEKSLQAVVSYCKSNNIKVESPPFVQYLVFPKHKGDDDKIVFKAGAFINQEVELFSNQIKQQKIKDSKTLECIHQEANSLVEQTHQKILYHAKSNNLSLTSPAYEFYQSNPLVTTKMEDRKTKVVYMLE